MRQVVISGTGVFTPDEIITNEELVIAFNSYVDQQNQLHADAIAAGERPALEYSNEDFIFKASGIRQRHVMDKSGVLNPDQMYPSLRQRDDEEPGIMTELARATHAATQYAAQISAHLRTACRNIN